MRGGIATLCNRARFSEEGPRRLICSSPFICVSLYILYTLNVYCLNVSFKGAFVVTFFVQKLRTSSKCLLLLFLNQIILFENGDKNTRVD
jgi:hypothetical protein